MITRRELLELAVLLGMSNAQAAAEPEQRAEE